MTSLLKSFLPAAAVGTLLACNLASAAEPPPPLLTYHAISDTQYRPKPPLPAMGPAGSIVNDPAFGCPILRVTDENTFHGMSCITPASAEQNTWNVDSTLFYALTTGMKTLAHRFDPKAMKATPLDDVPQGVACFSHHDANLIWGVRGGGVVFTYDFASGKSTDVLDVAAVAQMPVTRTGAFHVSAGDVVSIIFGGHQQDEDMYLLVYDTKTKVHHLWNTREGTLDGKALPADGPTFTMHNGTIDETGRFVCAAPGGPVKNGVDGPIICDLEKGTVYGMTVERWGHRVMGYGDMINDIHKWVWRSLDAEGINKPRDLMEHPKGEVYFGYDTHPSWNNTRPSLKVPMLTSTYHLRQDADPKCAWGDEIVAVATDGSGTVWRFAHNRSSVGKPNYNFWDTPRGNVSQDGRFFMFTSNWEDTLGKDKGQDRDDVFIVKLESALPIAPTTTGPATK